MKKVKFSHRMGAKILAFTLLFPSVIAFIGSLVGLYYCYDLGAFSPDFQQPADYYGSNSYPYNFDKLKELFGIEDDIDYDTEDE